MSKHSYTFALSSLLLLTPALAFAQVKDLHYVITIIIGYLNEVLVLMIGVAVVMFVYYIIKYFIKADAERKEAGPYVMWSLIGFFVVLSLWGLVNILQNTFNLKNENNQPASWTSFKGLFPAGGNSTYSGNGSQNSTFSGNGSQNSTYSGNGSTGRAGTNPNVQSNTNILP